MVAAGYAPSAPPRRGRPAPPRPSGCCPPPAPAPAPSGSLRPPPRPRSPPRDTAQQFLAPERRQVPPSRHVRCKPIAPQLLDDRHTGPDGLRFRRRYPQHVDLSEAALDRLVGLINVQVFKERVRAGEPRGRSVVAPQQGRRSPGAPPRYQVRLPGDGLSIRTFMFLSTYFSCLISCTINPERGARRSPCGCCRLRLTGSGSSRLRHRAAAEVALLHTHPNCRRQARPRAGLPPPGRLFQRYRRVPAGRSAGTGNRRHHPHFRSGPCPGITAPPHPPLPRRPGWYRRRGSAPTATRAVPWTGTRRPSCGRDSPQPSSGTLEPSCCNAPGPVARVRGQPGELPVRIAVYEVRMPEAWARRVKHARCRTELSTASRWRRSGRVHLTPGSCFPVAHCSPRPRRN